MKRLEFAGKVKDQAFARSGGRCENKACGALLTVGKYAYDHILPAALGGKPTLANCQVICLACHTAKTSKEDVPRIRKADRQRRKHIGATTKSGPGIQSAGFRPAAPQKKASKPPAAGSKLEQTRALGAGEIARRYGAEGG
jgi:hypothetical protein